jgi:hypothetical protein
MESNKITKEYLDMQKLAGIITETEYKQGKFKIWKNNLKDGIEILKQILKDEGKNT